MPIDNGVKKVLFFPSCFDPKIDRYKLKIAKLNTQLAEHQFNLQQLEQHQNSQVRLLQSYEDFINYKNPADYFLPKMFSDSDKEFKWRLNIDRQLIQDIKPLRAAYDNLKKNFDSRRPTNKSALTFDAFKYATELSQLHQLLMTFIKSPKSKNRIYREISETLHSMAKKCSVNDSLEALSQFIAIFDDFKSRCDAYQSQKGAMEPKLQMTKAQLKINNHKINELHQKIASCKIEIHHNNLEMSTLITAKTEAQAECAKTFSL